jgi:3-oxoadipyl-CoA thiolase
MTSKHDDPRTPVILAALRTPIGRYGGALKDVRPDDLAAQVLHELVQRSGIDPVRIDEVILGCANQAGEDNRNVARMAALLAGFPDSVPGVTVNRLCASGLSAAIMAAWQIRAGEGDLLIAGGVESMSRAPYAVPKSTGDGVSFGNLTAYDTALGWRFPNPRLAERFPLESMGDTAENLVERYGISREEQDAFALASHRKAVAAQDAGHYDAELVPVEIPRRKGEPTIISLDEGPRADTTPEKLASLAPAFRKGGSVTAGNSSSLNDGAAALLVASLATSEKLGLRPLARIVSSGTAGVDPRYMGIGPVPAAHLALQRAGLPLDAMDVIELNEAFSSQSIAVLRELGADPAKVNPNGGAIALGHPLGCSGARILTTLVHELERRGARYGLAAMCVGVGQGVAAVVERAG